MYGNDERSLSHFRHVSALHWAFDVKLKVVVLLDKIKELTGYSVLANERDTEDFHLGFELTLPRELQEILAGKTHSSQIKSKNVFEKENSFLDEHELALG